MNDASPTNDASRTINADDHRLVRALGRRVGTRQREWLREAVTMALYVSLSQLAVMVGLPESVREETGRAGISAIILITSIALVLAHQIAFRISSRLVDAQKGRQQVPATIQAQLLGGGFSTLIAVIPLVIFGPRGLWLSSTLLVVFVCTVAYAAARSEQANRWRALAYVCVIILAITAVTVLKTLVLH